MNALETNNETKRIDKCLSEKCHQTLKFILNPKYSTASSVYENQIRDLEFSKLWKEKTRTKLLIFSEKNFFSSFQEKTRTKLLIFSEQELPV